MAIFDTFMMFYYGFFGVTLILNPSIHALDGPVPNPLAYWTTLSAETSMAFRLAGCSFLTFALGPKILDVSDTTFVKQMLLCNTLLFFLFLYYSFYSPLDTAVTFMWEGQAFLGGLILGWNIIEAYDGVSSKELLALFAKFIAGFFGFFGVALLTAPVLLFGPPSPLAYWSEWPDLAVLCARSLGATLIGVTILGYYYHPTPSYVKQAAAFCTINLPLFALAAFGYSATAVTWIWKAQLAMQLPITMVALYLVTPPRTLVPAFEFKLAPPAKWALDAETFVFVNVLFFIPFVLAFLTDPNFVFGPSSPGVPMFTIDMGPTGLWFGKAWAIAIMLLALGPAAFGLEPLKVVKTMLPVYLAACVIFIQTLTSSDVFNPTLMWPMTALNFVFLFVAVAIVKRSVDEGEALLYTSMA